MHSRHEQCFFSIVSLGVAFLLGGASLVAAERPPKGGASAPTARRGADGVSAEVDRLLDERRREADVPASPVAGDAEFLRRVTLDITGRIPSDEEAVAFLDDSHPEKRRLLIDRLLERASYGRHFATIWRELIAPPDTSSKKAGKDDFTPWLAEQFNRNRPWSETVRDLLTAEGKIRETPQAGFVTANSEQFDPQPNLLADATARLFWGVQLRCAECHNHPFASWTQSDFWGTAAFFSRLRRGYTEGKNAAGWTLTEAPPDEPISQKFGVVWAAEDVDGPAIVVPISGGKLAGQTVRARFLSGDEADWTDGGPYRTRFAEWATGSDNPYFAANAVNRMWAHFFGRGLVNPLDEFHEGNSPSHAELLQTLAAEMVASNYDLKHLARCICNSQAYQRTSIPTDANESDNELFSHHAVRVMRPEVLYDSLALMLFPPPVKPGSSKTAVADAILLIPNVSRDDFVRFFGVTNYENNGSVVNQGAPQFLRLMNGPLLNGGGPGLDRFTRRGREPSQVIEDLHLAAYARRPTSEESLRLEEYVAAHADPDEAYSGVLWALLNSSEFALNH